MKDPNKKIHISADEADRLKNISGLLKDGRSHDGVIESLKKFVRTDLKAVMIGRDQKARLDAKAFEERIQLYERYAAFSVTNATLNRAMDGTGVTRSADYYYLREIVDLYLAHYDHLLPKAEKTDRGADGPFPRQVAYTLMERAHRFCTNPACRRPTSAPSLQDPSGVYRMGMACAINGAAPGDPRYDPQLPYKYDDIENGIWLCSVHAIMINADMKGDFPASQLKDWKRLHESMLHAVATGEKRMVFEMKSEEGDRAPAQQLLDFFNGPDLLYCGPGLHPQEHIITLVKDIEVFLEELDGRIFYASMLGQQLDSIYLACEAFLEQTAHMDHASTFNDGFCILTKIIGGLLADTAAFYELDIPDRIRDIMPAVSPG